MLDLLSLADASARARIVEDLDATLFVDAGAGSGKTKALVDRVIALVEAGVEVRSIAAITFTEKAGAELRDRLRRALVARDLSTDQLDGAAIGTLHSFAQRILSEHPVEAGLPPRVEVLDEVSSGLEFERRWRTFLDELLDDPDVEDDIVTLVALGVRPDSLRLLALAFDNNWDLVEARVPAALPARASVTTLIEPALGACDRAVAHLASCRFGDSLSEVLERIEVFAAALRALGAGAPDGGPDLVERLADAPSFKVGNKGRAQNWPDKHAVQADVVLAGDAVTAAANAIATACVERVGAALRRFTLRAAEERRASGRLEFHDLLVMARALLRANPEVCAHLHRTYTRILLDEFQDTDPIQIELAVRIAASGFAGEMPWDQIPVVDGHLFVVGDPKQSIYRFRRADIRTFRRARARFGPAVGLTSNFRSVAPIIDWVNVTFGALLAPSGDFSALDPVRPAAPQGAAVARIGVDALDADQRADDMRTVEASAVAAAIVEIVTDGWSVSDDSGGSPAVPAAGPGSAENADNADNVSDPAGGLSDSVGRGWRPARLGDIAILVPARTSPPFLEDALDAAKIPFRAEASSLVYATRAVRDLLMVLRAADDPTDHLRVVAALRTPLLGCGDDDLYRHRVEHEGTWNYLADAPAPGIVADGLAYLRTLHERRLWHTPSELLTMIAVDRRAFELAVAEGRPRDVWRRFRFVIDQARAWHEVAGGSLRHYLRWVGEQTTEGARVAEAVLPETDEDAVRIMTIHAAKGLEFPITIVSGLSTAPQSRRAAVDVVFPDDGGVGYRAGAKVETPIYEEWKPIDEQMADDERRRLLYVACTRARDHLVVSVHRKARNLANLEPNRLTNAELLFADGGDLPVVGDRWLGSSLPPASVRGGVVGELGSFEEWLRVHDAALDQAPTTVSATGLSGDAAFGGADGIGDVEDGLHKGPRDLDLPPWLKGRYGSAVGRAVHGVLQTVDLASGAEMDALVATQCQAEAIPTRTSVVSGLVRSALGAPCVRAASASQHWREVYACAPLTGGHLLEGYVDLLYRTPDGLVVVDYKTAATADPDELERRSSIYRTQGASYALMVLGTTGQPVVRVTFLFLTPAGPIERDLPDLDAAVSSLGVVLQGS